MWSPLAGLTSTQEKRAVVFVKASAMWLATALSAVLRRLYRPSKPGDSMWEKESVKSALRSRRRDLPEASGIGKRNAEMIAWDCLLGDQH